MSDSSDVKRTQHPPTTSTDKPHKVISPGPSTDEIPVDELVRITRELTERITNLDRQRLALQLKQSKRSIKTNAPVTLQQFFTGEIDLDSELSKRFVNAPLLSQVNLYPKRPTPLLQSRRAVALLSTQDNAAQMTFDVDVKNGSLEVTFTLSSMLAFRFDIGEIEEDERQRWLDLMRRQSGIAFLWTAERWDNDYIIFVVRENFARLYAFSSQRFEASARITPDIMIDLLDWLEAFWFPDQAVTVAPPEKSMHGLAGASVGGNYMVTPSKVMPAQVDLPTEEDTQPGPEDEADGGSLLDW